MFYLLNVINIVRKMNMINHVILFTIISIWSQMFADGYIYSGRENETTEDHKQCKSCSCETISANNNCALQFCTRLWELCRESNKLIDLSQKPKIENTNNSVTMELKRDWYEDIYNTDKPDRNNIIIDSRDPIKQSDKRCRRSTELEREQNKSNKHCHLETHQLIRFLSVDYKIPVQNSDSEIKSIIAVILHSTVLAIGIMICILVYKKYGYFDVKEHKCNIYKDKLTQKYLTNNNAVLKTDRTKAATIKTFLIDHPPSYGACVV